MATVQLVPMTTTNGMTTTQLIITQVSPDRPKLILPKQEPHMETEQPSKRRIHFSKKALTHPRPQSVTRRNARERNRVKQVNQGKKYHIAVLSSCCGLQTLIVMLNKGVIFSMGHAGASRSSSYDAFCETLSQINSICQYLHHTWWLLCP